MIAKIDFIVGFDDYTWEYQSHDVPLSIARKGNEDILKWYGEKANKDEEPLFVYVYWRDPNVDCVSSNNKLN